MNAKMYYTTTIIGMEVPVHQRCDLYRDLLIITCLWYAFCCCGGGQRIRGTRT